jgi:hypothetical protein
MWRRDDSPHKGTQVLNNVLVLESCADLADDFAAAEHCLNLVLAIYA